MISLSLVKRFAYIYLLIPIFIFGIGWLNAIAALFFTLLIISGLISVWKKESQQGFISSGRWDWLFAGFLLFFWIYLSGIGGFTFQNWDYHSRNAVFRDLINYSWPVNYHLDPDVASRYHAPVDVILSYYFGFWLPAAIIGKLAGWGSANLFLFVWSFVGVILAVILTAANTKLSLGKTVLLVVFFGGMDIVGVWSLQNIPGYNYPGIWPPIQHLEWWAGNLQYSSFTTGLFWTYNQFVPVLIVMSLFMLSKNSGNTLFLLGICFFFAPLPALGLLLFVAIKLVNEVASPWAETRGKVWSILFGKISTPENITGIFVALISLIFYSTNLSARSRIVSMPSTILVYLIFILLEGMLIWLLLLPMYRKDWVWYVSGFLLIIAPFIKIGGSWDFMMRSTLPSLYILMLGCGKFFAEKKEFKINILLLLLLILGALTPVFEINRSLVRIDRFYGYRIFSRDYFEQYFQNLQHSNQAFIPEADHLDTLIADDWQSVSTPNESGWDTKVGTLFNPSISFFWKDELIQK